MQQAEILAIEAVRDTEEKCRAIHLWKEGTFLIAYEWSAWLFAKSGIDLKIVVREKKGEVSAVAVGFPNSAKSWAKFIPQGCMTNPTSTENHIVVDIPQEAFGNTTLQDLAGEYAKWRQDVIAKDKAAGEKASKKSKPADPQTAATPQVAAQAPARPCAASALTVLQRSATSIIDLMLMVISIDLANLTPFQCQTLVREFQAESRRLMLG